MSRTLNLNAKEDPETFHWISDNYARKDYELAKKALDTIPGSREWLKNYVMPEDKMPFFDGIGPQVMDAFGSHHSGFTATRVALNYRFLLNNWDKFVLDTKTYYAKKAYDYKCTFCGSMESECGGDHADEKREIMRRCRRDL